MEQSLIDSLQKICPQKLYTDMPFLSISHFLYLQPHDIVKQLSYANADARVLNNGNLYVWLPGTDDMNFEYVAKARNCIYRVMRESPNFKEITLDLRNNPGGIMLDFINAIYPLYKLFIPDNRDKTELMYIYNRGVVITKFILYKNKVSLYKISGESFNTYIYEIPDDIKEIIKKKFGKIKFNILANERSGSSSEITIVIFLDFANAKLYNTYKTRTYGITTAMDGVYVNPLIQITFPYGYYQSAKSKIIYGENVFNDPGKYVGVGIPIDNILTKDMVY